MAGGDGDVAVSLQNLLMPLSYSAGIPLPSTTLGCPQVPEGHTLRGFVSQDCQWGWFYNHNVIKCFQTEATSGGKPVMTIPAVSQMGYQFSEDIIISCVIELGTHNQKIMSGMKKLLLGLIVGNGVAETGAVVIFDPIKCQPIKWIILPAAVTSLTVLSHYEEGGVKGPFFNGAMMAMVGVAAVGMKGGSVIIMDLGLDDTRMSGHGHALDHNAPYPKMCLFPVRLDDPFIAKTRHDACKQDVLIFLELMSELNFQSDRYHYCNPEGEDLGDLPKEDVAVTCLEYIPNIGSIVVGFNFGCFQIWKVENLQLIYSLSTPASEEYEVFGVSFQQPTDDPKNYCYIWVLYGKRTLELHYSHAELYSLLYDRKQNVENIGCTYDGFQKCNKRISIELREYFDAHGDIEEPSDEENYSELYSVRPIRMWPQTDSLTFFVWESSRNGRYYVGIFDLNQWYSNHMLEKIRSSTDSGLCPYWVAIPIETVDPMATVWDCRILPKSLEKWDNAFQKINVHTYPASLSFHGVCLSSVGVSTFERLGIQEKILRCIQRDGTQYFAEPSQCRALCYKYGLQPIYQPSTEEFLSDDERDRFYILSVLLENRRSVLIIALANVWLNGSCANVGCTIDLIMDWILRFMQEVRNSADQHWTELLNCVDVLSPDTIRFITYSNFAWTSLYGLLSALMKPMEIYEGNYQGLEDLKFGLEKLVNYSAGLLMFYKAGLLPQTKYGNEIHTLMKKYYDARRVTISEAIQSSTLLDDSLKTGPPLMIDYLLEHFDDNLLQEQWNVQPNESVYPPSHPAYVLNMIMWVHEDPKAIARIIAYYLMDISEYIDSQRRAMNGDYPCDSLKLRGHFGAGMHLTATEQNEIYQLWALDRTDQEKTTFLFLSQQDRITQRDYLPWCAGLVILTVTENEGAVADILQRSCPLSLGKLYCNLMVSNPERYSVLMEDICTSELARAPDVVEHFFQVADSANLLGEFIKEKSRVAPHNVIQSLVSYLKAKPTFENADRLLSIFIYLEDLPKLKEQLENMQNRFHSGLFSGVHTRRWEMRQRLVESLLRSQLVNPVEKFLSLQPFKPRQPQKPTVLIQVKRVPSTPVRDSSTVFDRIPSQLRRLKLFHSKSDLVLSPLQTYRGGRHAVVKQTPSSQRIQKDTPVSKSISIMESPKSHFTPDRSLKTPTRGYRSPLDLVSLLQTPGLNKSPASKMTLGSFSSASSRFCATPSMDITETEVHSIMKKKGARKRLYDKELRFAGLPDDDDKMEVKSCDKQEESTVDTKGFMGFEVDAAKTLSETIQKKRIILNRDLEDDITQKSATSDSVIQTASAVLQTDKMKTDTPVNLARASRTPDKVLETETGKIPVKRVRPPRTIRTPDRLLEFHTLEKRKTPDPESKPVDTVLETGTDKHMTTRASKTPERSLETESVTTPKKRGMPARSTKTPDRLLEFDTTEQRKTPDRESKPVDTVLETGTDKHVISTRATKTPERSLETETVTITKKRGMPTRSTKTPDRLLEFDTTEQRKTPDRESTPVDTALETGTDENVISTRATITKTPERSLETETVTIPKKRGMSTRSTKTPDRLLEFETTEQRKTPDRESKPVDTVLEIGTENVISTRATKTPERSLEAEYVTIRKKRGMPTRSTKTPDRIFEFGATEKRKTPDRESTPVDTALETGTENVISTRVTKTPERSLDAESATITRKRCMPARSTKTPDRLFEFGATENRKTPDRDKPVDTVLETGTEIVISTRATKTSERSLEAESATTTRKRCMPARSTKTPDRIFEFGATEKLKTPDRESKPVDTVLETGTEIVISTRVTKTSERSLEAESGTITRKRCMPDRSTKTPDRLFEFGATEKRKTPDRESKPVDTGLEIGPENVISTRVTKTPERSLDAESATIPKKRGRSTRSTKTPDHLLETEDDIPLERPVRSTRSGRTPDRSSEVDFVKPLEKPGRSTRSGKTPDRVEIDFVKSERSTRSSKTPDRTLEPEIEKTPEKRAVRGASKSKSPDGGSKQRRSKTPEKRVMPSRSSKTPDRVLPTDILKTPEKQSLSERTGRAKRKLDEDSTEETSVQTSTRTTRSSFSTPVKIEPTSPEKEDDDDQIYYGSGRPLQRIVFECELSTIVEDTENSVGSTTLDPKMPFLPVMMPSQESPPKLTTSPRSTKRSASKSPKTKGEKDTSGKEPEEEEENSEEESRPRKRTRRREVFEENDDDDTQPMPSTSKGSKKTQRKNRKGKSGTESSRKPRTRSTSSASPSP